MPEKLNIALAGGLLAGIAASLCCLGPLVLLSLGVGGAWASNLVALKPYRPVFVALAVAALLIAYFSVYRPESESCEDGKICAQPPVKRLYRYLFWSVAIIVFSSIASPYLISIMYE